MLDKVDVNFAYEDEGHRIEVTATAKVTEDPWKWKP